MPFRNIFQRRERFRRMIRQYTAAALDGVIGTITDSAKARRALRGRRITIRVSFRGYKAKPTSSATTVKRRQDRVKKSYLRDTLEDLAERIRTNLRNKDTSIGGTSVVPAEASDLHQSEPGRGTKREARKRVTGSLGEKVAGSLAAKTRGRTGSENVNVNIYVTPNRGEMRVTGPGLVAFGEDEYIRVPEGGFKRADGKPFAMFKPEAPSQPVFRNRIYTKFSGKFVKRVGVLRRNSGILLEGFS